VGDAGFGGFTSHPLPSSKKQHETNALKIFTQTPNKLKGILMQTHNKNLSKNQFFTLLLHKMTTKPRWLDVEAGAMELVALGGWELPYLYEKPYPLAFSTYAGYAHYSKNNMNFGERRRAF
jgi:hypothetical protein